MAYGTYELRRRWLTKLRPSHQSAEIVSHLNSKFFWPFTFMRNGQGNFGLDEERSPSATD